mgnify:CR=1 FL=1
MKRKDELPDCPVATTVSLIGSKWKLLILRNLLSRPWRFNELQKVKMHIADRNVYGIDLWKRTVSLPALFSRKYRLA